MWTPRLRYLASESPPKPQGSAGRGRRRSFVPRLEALEGRDVPSTLTVTNLNDTGIAGAGSLRGELAAAQSGDTIDFQSGLHGSVLLGSTLNLARNVAIQGNLDAAGNPLVTVDGQHRVRDVTVNSGVTASLFGLAIANGYAQYTNSDVVQGGGILNQGTLTLQSCAIAGNWAAGSQPVGPGEGSFVPGMGGGIFNWGVLTVQNSTFSGNIAGGFGEGGALMNWSAPWTAQLPPLPPAWRAARATISGCTFTGNSASYGGAIYDKDGWVSLTLQNSTIAGNTATLDGGGIYLPPLMSVALTAPLTASATTLSVEKALYFSKGLTILIDNEQMTVTGVDTVRNTLTVVRGVNQTAAAAHSLGANVINRSPCFDAFTLANLLNNSAPSNPNVKGPYFTLP
jgi:hypothetical protein